MPSRNIIKEYVSDSYYHVYARGVSKQKIFHDAQDYHYFYKILSRYLSKKQAFSRTGESYPHFHDRISLVAYCLMTNHFHLLIHQKDADDLQKFMRSVMTSYSRYFNLRHKRSGPVFESRYKASRINSGQYLEHITRYIHLNPRRWESYYNSSLRHYRGDNTPPEWLTIAPVMNLFTSSEDYLQFVADYEEMRDMMAELKYQLAD